MALGGVRVACAAPPALGPADAPVVAEVLGRPVRAWQADELWHELLHELTDRYAAELGRAVTKDEVRDYREAQRRFMATKGFVQPVAGSAPDDGGPVRDQSARASLLQHTIDAAMYRQYGGRLPARTGGALPVDAYRRFLEDQAVASRLSIFDFALESAFWRELVTESRHEFMPADSAAEAVAAHELLANLTAPRL